MNRLYDAQLGKEAPHDQDNQPRSRNPRNYIRFGPLGRAIVRASYGRRSVVLIDEIDKADLDFPNDLLWEFDRLEFSVAEVATLSFAVGDRPDLRPLVLITHNDEKPLPEAFLRRCIFHVIEFPEDESRLRDILVLHRITNDELSKKAIAVLRDLRKLDLRKKPGLSELIDWVCYLDSQGATPQDAAQLKSFGALLKQQDDRKLALETFFGGKHGTTG